MSEFDLVQQLRHDVDDDNGVEETKTCDPDRESPAAAPTPEMALPLTTRAATDSLVHLRDDLLSPPVLRKYVSTCRAPRAYSPTNTPGMLLERSSHRDTHIPQNNLLEIITKYRNACPPPSNFFTRLFRFRSFMSFMSVTHSSSSVCLPLDSPPFLCPSSRTTLTEGGRAHEIRHRRISTPLSLRFGLNDTYSSEKIGFSCCGERFRASNTAVFDTRGTAAPRSIFRRFVTD